MGFIEIVTMDENGVTNTPLENVDIVTYAELVASLAANDVTLITPKFPTIWG